MKTVLSLLVIFMAVGAHSQNFETSTTYIVKGADRHTVDQHNALGNWESGDSIPARIVLAADTNSIVLNFIIDWPDTYDSTYVKELQNPGLKNIKKIILVQVEYAACCYDVQAHYYLITKKDKLIELDIIGYSMCDWPDKIPEYRFPSQKYGEANNIISAELYYGYEGTIDSTKTIDVVNWNGKKINP